MSSPVLGRATSPNRSERDQRAMVNELKAAKTGATLGNSNQSATGRKDVVNDSPPGGRTAMTDDDGPGRFGFGQCPVCGKSFIKHRRDHQYCCRAHKREARDRRAGRDTRYESSSLLALALYVDDNPEDAAALFLKKLSNLKNAHGS